MKLIDYVIIWWFLSSVMINYSIWLNFLKWVFQNFGVFVLKLYIQVNSFFLKYNWTVLNALENASFFHFIHASYRLILSIIVFSLTLSDAVCPWFSFSFLFFFFSFLFVVVVVVVVVVLFCFCFGLSFPSLSIIVRKTRANKKTTSTSIPAFDSDRFRFEKNQEAYEKLNIFRFVWVERKVVLDELDRESRRNFEHRGWLALLDISHSPPVALIREFYLNLFIHSDDSNVQYVMSWIRGEEYTITLSVVASAFGVPLVRQPIYHYDETPHLDDIYHFSLVLPFSGVLILVIPSMSSLRFIICFSWFFVILFGPSLMCTPFILRNVHFCMPLWLIPLWVFLLFLFDPWLRFIGVTLQYMVFSSLFYT